MSNVLLLFVFVLPGYFFSWIYSMKGLVHCLFEFVYVFSSFSTNHDVVARSSTLVTTSIGVAWTVTVATCMLAATPSSGSGSMRRCGRRALRVLRTSFHKGPLIHSFRSTHPPTLPSGCVGHKQGHIYIYMYIKMH